jgi:hypothetical protein
MIYCDFDFVSLDCLTQVDFVVMNLLDFLTQQDSGFLGLSWLNCDYDLVIP